MLLFHVPPIVGLPASLVTDASGAVALPFIWPAGLPAETTLIFQYAIQDAAGPQGVSLSNALRALTP